MQFLSDVFIRCPDCDGRRYRAHILEVKLPNASRAREAQVRAVPCAPVPLAVWSIADVLEATVDEAIGIPGRFS